MTSFFKLVSQSCGLPLNEVGTFLNTKPDTTKSWWLGRRSPPESVLEKLIDLSIKQDFAAQQLLLDMGLLDDQSTHRTTLKIGGSDLEAQSNGWPSANAYRAVIRRAVEKMPSTLALRLILVSSENAKV